MLLDSFARFNLSSLHVSVTYYILISGREIHSKFGLELATADGGVIEEGSAVEARKIAT